MGTGMFASVVVVLSLAACTEHGKSPQRGVFDGEVEPVLRQRCVASGCHDSSAAGALDLTSYAGIDRRRDLLEPDNPLLLRKADGTAVHAGGKSFDIGSEDYEILLAWIEDGAPE